MDQEDKEGKHGKVEAAAMIEGIEYLWKKKTTKQGNCISSRSFLYIYTTNDIAFTSTFAASAVAVSTTLDSWRALKAADVVASLPWANRKPAKQSFEPPIYDDDKEKIFD